MQHNILGPKLSRDTGQRQALLKGLAGALIRSEAIETTYVKASAAKILMEKLITKARRGTLSDVREVEAVITDKDLVNKLIHEIAPRFKGRPGGYLRLIKLGNRAGDNAPMVRMEFTTESAPQISTKSEPKSSPDNPSKAVKPQAKASPKTPARVAKTRKSQKSISSKK